MSDEEGSDCEVPVCGSFEPQVWRKGYCRNCFHPGSKHQGGDLIIDDKRKFGKDNIHKKTDKSKENENDKIQPSKQTGQESGKTVKDKISDKLHDKQTDKDKSSFKDRFEKLQKDKSNQDEKGSNRKLGSDKLDTGRKSIPDKLDSSKNIPPPVAPKTKGLDKLKSKSTSDIREEMKSPVGNKLFKQSVQSDTLDKSKSKFGSAENVSSTDKKTDMKIKTKTGSAENLATDKLGSLKKPDKSKTDTSDTSKPDYRNLLSNKSTKSDDRSKDTASLETRDKANKTDKDKKSDDNKLKLDIGTNKKDSPNKLLAQLKSPSTSEKSPLFEKDKPDFKTKFDKPELKSSKKDDKGKNEKIDTIDKSKLKSVHDSEKKKETPETGKPQLKSTQKEIKDDSDKLKKPELKSTQDKAKKDETSTLEKHELKPTQEKDKKDEKSKFEKPQLKRAEEKEKTDFKAKFEKPGLNKVEEKEKVDFKTKYEKPSLKKVEEPDKKDYKTKYEKPELSKDEEKEKVDYHLKMDKPELKKVEEKEKVDYHLKMDKPELKKVDEKEKVDYHLKMDKPELKKVDEKEKKDYKTKYEKPELKTVEDKEKKDYRAKFDKPELKSSKTDDKKKDEKDDSKRKSSISDRITGLKTTQEKDESASAKGKWKPKGSAEEKDKLKTEGVKTDLKAGLKSVKTDDKNKSSLSSTKVEEKDKNKSSPASKWLGSLDKDKSKDNKTDDQKLKADKFPLKSVKNDEKAKDKSVLNKLKSVKDDKVDLKKGLTDDRKTKTEGAENEVKTKLDKSNLKSSKTDETEKKDFKAKFEKPQLKSAKADEKENVKTPKTENKDVILSKASSKEEDREAIENELNQRAEIESIKQKKDRSHIEDKDTTLKHSDTDSLKHKSQVNEKNVSSDTGSVKSVPPANYSQKSDNLSSDAETDLDEPDNACALSSTRGKSPVHVDTQVFTSSRNKSAGVEGTESDLYTTTPQKGLSGSLSSENLTESQKSAEKETKVQNDKLPDSIAQKTSKEGLHDDHGKRDVENDVEKLKKELMKMAEKCEKLEEENASLKHGLSAKESDHTELEKQKREVEGLILGLQGQLKSMEDKCIKMESENANLMASLKQQEETSKAQPATEEPEATEDGIRYTESMVEDLIEQNEELKQEIQDLKVEMEEMYDSFRDQEAEEFRELQKELEITAKNCRILQFKMRKAERRNEQLEDDRNLYEDKLRILQNQFENKDAVAHIKTLEQELKMAKEVSVRLHDELDMMDDKRGKVEEENRHLTDLLEQADRKQFRLEIEVDKLRDQIVDLRQRLAAASSSNDPDDPPRKVMLSSTERQSSQEIDVQQIKRELYDSKEREADLRDQLKFLEDDAKKMRKKMRDLEDENDNMSKHLKKMTIQQTLATMKQGEGLSPRDRNGKAEAAVELKVQYDLVEGELSVFKKKMADMEEENEMLHKEMFEMEKKLKEKDHLLQLPAEPSSPNTFYMDKIKEYEKEADELRWKIIEKDNEIEQLYGKLKVAENRQIKGVKGLRKSRSLDNDDTNGDSDYGQIVDLKRQLEFSQQEANVLRDKVTALEAQNIAQESEIELLKLQNQQQNNYPLTGLAVAYVDTENESQLRTQIKEMDSDRIELVAKISELAEKCNSLTAKHCSTFLQKVLPEIPVEQTLSSAGGMHTREDWSRDQPLNFAGLKTQTLASPGNDLMESGNMASSQEIREMLPRDPEKLLAHIDESFCMLVQRIDRMESDEEKIVQVDTCPSQGGDSPDLPDRAGAEEEGTPAPMDGDTSENGHSPDISDKEIEMKTDSDPNKCVPSPDGTSNEMDDDKNISMSSEQVSDEGKIMSDVTSSSASTAEDGHEGEIEDLVIPKERDHLMDKILDLEEEVDDLRLIIKAKEESNISLEKELEDLTVEYKLCQDDSRRRETELLQDLDMLHDKNEILSNLLDLVKDRAEAAEAELERVITEYNEDKDSCSTSSTEEKTSVSALSGVSVGSDDVFDSSVFEKAQVVNAPRDWEEQLKKRVNSLEKLLAEERHKVAALEKKLTLTGSETLSSAMSDDVKLHMREKELLLSELQESQKHVRIASDQIRGLTDKLKRVESDKWRLSPRTARKAQNDSSASADDVFLDRKESTRTEVGCLRCAELQTVKDELREELLLFKAKADELEGKVDEINDIWISKNATTEAEKAMLEQTLKQKLLEFKGLQDNFGKLKEEDRMKDIFLKERDNVLKEKAGVITRKEEIIQEQEEIIRQREEDLQSLLDQISQRETQIKQLTETIRLRDDRLKEKDDILQKLNANLEEKIEEVHYLEEEVQDSTIKRKESESIIAEMQDQISEAKKGDKSEIEQENDRLHADIDNLMTNITDLHGDKVTLQNELDKAKHALSEAMLMWDRDRSTLGAELNIAREKVRMLEATANKSDTKVIATLRKEVHNILEIKEKLANELRINRMDHDNNVRILQAEKFKLTEELTSKIRMLTKEMSDNDKMSSELVSLRGQEDINYQLHHHEKILRAEYMAMKVRYETQLERLQKEHIQLLTICEKLQREKNLDQEIIVGIQKSMQNIRETYTSDLSRWKGERNVLEKHISQIDEGKEIALHLRSQIDDLKRQLADQELERSELVNRMTLERKSWDIEKATLNSHINQLEEQLAIFIQAQSKSKDMQYRMEVTWEKERADQTRLLKEAHDLTMDLQDQLHKREEEHARERKNLLEQLEKERRKSEKEKNDIDKKDLEIQTRDANTKHLEKRVEDLQEKHRKDQEFWQKEKGELLRRLATMRNVHNRDVRRTEDVLTGLKRLRELAALIIESDGNETLPSEGTCGGTSGGDASAAASTSPGAGDSSISDIKQNIDQVILKYVKESLKQIHFAAEDLARPVAEITKEEKQTMRRSLSSSEIELLKDEFLMGAPETGKITSHHEPVPEIIKDIKPPKEREHVLQRSITHDASEHVDTESVPRNYVENILKEQSTFYSDEQNKQTKEVHKFTVTQDFTRTETQVMKLPKPPPSFIIPRSRSSSPAPSKPKRSTEVSVPLYKSISIETTHQHRMSAPPEGATSRSSSADSSPMGYKQFVPGIAHGVQVLPGAGVLQTGSLDRLSPQTARKRFFDSQPTSGVTYLSWPERNRRLLAEDRDVRSLSNSTDIQDSDRESTLERKYGLRTSLSMDDSTMQAISHPVGTGVSAHERSKSAQSESRRKQLSKSQSVVDSSESKHSGIKDLFNTVKRKLKPKLRRSHSAHVPNMESPAVSVEKPGPSVSTPSLDEPGCRLTLGDEATDKQTVRDHMEPIQIPEEKTKVESSKERSRSRGKKHERDDTKGKSTSLFKRFRSKSADRTTSRDQQVHPILIGHSTGSQGSDASWQFSETPV